MKITLEYPPSCNRYWRNWRGRMVLSEEARAYKKQVFLTAVKAGLIEPLQGLVRVSIDLYRPQHSGDLDNFQKVVWDSLQGVAYVDDSQIVEIHARRFDDKLRPRVEVTIEPIEQMESTAP